MLVHWYDPTGTLITSRPQTAVPARGSPVPVREADGSVSRYVVGEVAWPLDRQAEGREWYGLTDAGRVEVCVYCVEAGETV